MNVVKDQIKINDWYIEEKAERTRQSLHRENIEANKSKLAKNF